MHGRVFGATSSLLAFVKEGHELPNSLQQPVALRRPPRTRLRERQRPADRVGGAEDAAEAAGVAERSLHHVADGVLDGESTGVKLERASLRRSAERLAGRLAAEEAAAAVGAAGLAREPDSARVEGVGPEVVEARVQVGEGGLEVEAADCLQVLVAREPVRASNVRPHEDILGREKLRLLGALAIEEKGLCRRDELSLAERKVECFQRRSLVEEHRVGGRGDQPSAFLSEPARSAVEAGGASDGGPHLRASRHDLSL
mmetsp:Transcript_28248/g.84324  ORF Transcript_28248/g.84324 Transcript_28248/m.84324 type:complete len:257 (-) Transcript_28248:96-866(-)